MLFFFFFFLNHILKASQLPQPIGHSTTTTGRLFHRHCLQSPSVLPPPPPQATPSPPSDTLACTTVKRLQSRPTTTTTGRLFHRLRLQSPSVLPPPPPQATITTIRPPCQYHRQTPPISSYLTYILETKPRSSMLHLLYQKTISQILVFSFPLCQSLSSPPTPPKMAM
ncbi:hypothetical protein L2E82_47487 [Cichorium intybus]|uniref:Uncharacterized protein n=1 Tax=Cichorium intybus TaxID=13427 RepID=A0ACB8YUW7_CICIN|nr:hypothetical protein L2E82_47487 [Cichorium intybus]